MRRDGRLWAGPTCCEHCESLLPYSLCLNAVSFPLGHHVKALCRYTLLNIPGYLPNSHPIRLCLISCVEMLVEITF